ncbi:MAG TPA: SdrD B-like domain-containing protein, partial [Methylomirabilota bacterium]|nr:SdrD B-like domain-containing protein [Methylomirabilota bacterium]
GFFLELDEFVRVHHLGGRVRDGANGISGVSVQATNATTSATVTTDVNGRYLFTTLQAGDYVVVLVSGATNFSPASHSVMLNTATTNLDFVRIYSLSGRVTEGTNPVPGVFVTLSNASLTIGASTDANGAYVFSALEAGQYVVHAPTNGLAYTPLVITNVLPPAVTNADFTGAPVMLGAAAVGGGLALEALGVPGHTYVFQSASMRTNGVWIPFSTNVAGPDGRVRAVHVPSNGPALFYRVGRP